MSPTITGQTAEELFDSALAVLPGGVSAAARVHASIGRPFFAARGQGSRVWDLEGREYVDLNMSFGAALLGHGNPRVREAIESALDLGVLCGFETRYQEEVARKITEFVPCAELVRFTMTGTETTWHAIRTARAYTGRQKVIKFEGHFHGFNDALGFSMWPPLDEAGPRDAPRIIPASGGMPAEAASDILLLPWNDIPAMERCLEANAGVVAAVIMEPIAHNAGTIMPAPGYLESVRDLTRRHGVVLIFDEILSGFRTGPGGAQAYLGVTPDMCTLGKCLGGGTPLSAFTGSREVMGAVAPLGSAVHSGTFNAHLISMLAADAFLDAAADSRNVGAPGGEGGALLRRPALCLRAGRLARLGPGRRRALQLSLRPHCGADVVSRRRGRRWGHGHGLLPRGSGAWRLLPPRSTPRLLHHAQQR